MTETAEKHREWRYAGAAGAFVVFFWAIGGIAAPPDRNDVQSIAKAIFQTSGVQGGLVVHLGCGNGRLTGALRPNERYLVQGLDTDAANIQSARQSLQSCGVYGPVSADQFDGQRLPYIDNLVNLLVISGRASVDKQELLRVLCPGGVAVTVDPRSSTRELLRKPWPKQIDEWTHYLYNASNNAVSHDMVVGPPRHFQWNGSPRWARHHDRRASVSAMVSAGGRIFYIFDEGSTASIVLPSKTVLIARDAFNGTILWKRQIPKWFPYLWPFKSGPAQLQRRLVAVGDRVYVTLGLDAPLVALDAATGKTLQTYDGTFATEEVIDADGVLFVLVNESPQVYDDFRPEEVGIGQERDRTMVQWPWNAKPRHIQAIQANTGKRLWQTDASVIPLTLAVDRSRVYFHDGEQVVALNRQTGETVWKSEPVKRREIIPTNITPTLVVYQNVVLFDGATNELTGLSATTGKILWSGPHPPSGHYCAEDVLVAGGLVWGGAISGTRDDGVFVGRDPQTGEIKSQFPPDTDIYFMHQRCYRSKATDRFLIPSRTGTEFIDFRNEHWMTNHWVRGGCIYGVMPSNGLLYTPAHDCACYMQAKLYGFCALAPKEARGDNKARGNRQQATGKGQQARAENRLQRGPAASQALDSRPSTLDASADWPTYRHDAARSGFTTASVPANLKPTWNVSLGGRVSAPVIVDGTLFVAQVDTHTVHAVEATSGKKLWSYTVGGRVDSPPTVVGGRVLFGSADGSVYCLRASDGVLVWRFRAAPEDRRMTSFEQVESVWPVHGSVLVQDGVVYCVAGRSMFLDGGLHYLRLDVRTGRKLGETIFDEHDPETSENLESHVMVRNMPVSLPDILSSDDDFVYMRSQRFDRDGNRFDVAPHSGKDAEQGAVQTGVGVHLFSPTGFLDDTWWHRSYWVYGRSFAEGAGGWPQAGKNAPGGRILAVDQSTVYGFGRKATYYRWRTPLEYHLFASSKTPEIVRDPVASRRGKKPARRPRVQHPEYRWSRSVPLQVRAMVVAGNTLFIAGPPDVLDEEEAFRRFGEPEIQKELAEQDAVLNGAQGASLWAVSATDGQKLTEQPLDSLPIFDGLAAAQGCLYLSTVNGQVICFKEQ